MAILARAEGELGAINRGDLGFELAFGILNVPGGTLDGDSLGNRARKSGLGHDTGFGAAGK